MKHLTKDGFEYLELEDNITAAQVGWLIENVGAFAQKVPPKPYQVLAKWWTIQEMVYETTPTSTVFKGYQCLLGFRNLNDAMRFKLTWAGV